MTTANHAIVPATRPRRFVGRLHISLARWTPVLLIAITALGGLLRFYRIGDKGLWLDEAFSVWMGWQTLPDLLTWVLRVDQHPPLYYTLLHFWLLLGDSAAQARSLSALFGTLTIPVIFFIGRRMAGSGVGLIAAFILALSPFHVRFAQEARMYTLLTLNASLAILALVILLSDPRAAAMPFGRQLGDFVRAWRAARRAQSASPQNLTTPPADPQNPQPPSHAGLTYRADFRAGTAWVSAPTQRRWLPLHTISTDVAWGAYMVFTAATVLSHNTAVFFPIAANLFVLGFIAVRRRWPPSSAAQTGAWPDFAPPSLNNWLLAQCGAFLLWSFWLVAFIIQSMGVYEEFWIPPPTVGTVVEMLRTFLIAFLPAQISWAQLIWVAFALLAALGALHLRRRPAMLLFLLALILTPMLGEWLVSLRRPIFYDRTLIWTTIPLYLLLACGFRQLTFRPYILAGLVMLATLNLLALRDYYQYFEKEQWREAAAFVAENVQNDDLLLFNATWVQIPFDFYFRAANRPVAEHGAPVDLFDRGILEPKMRAEDLPRLRSLLRDRQRVWLIYSHDWYTDPQKLIPRALEEELDLVNERRFYGLEIRQYETP